MGKVSDAISAGANVLIAIVTLIALISGWYAYSFYREANAISLTSILESADNKIYDLALEHDKPYLIRMLYFEPPEGLSPTKRAEAAFLSLFEKDVPIKWKNVHDITTIYIKNKEMLRTDEGKRVVEAIISFERVISICQRVYVKSTSKLLKNTDWVCYAKAYIKDYEENPLFLTAIHLNHAYGYYEKEFFVQLVKEYKNSEVVKALYPEMLQPGWIEKYGHGCP